MLPGLPSLATEIFSALPQEFHLAHIETEWTRVRSRVGLHSFLEGPVFDQQGRLWCVDLAHGRIFRISPEGNWHLFKHYQGRPNGLAIGPDGRIVVADALMGILSFDPDTAEMRVLLAEHGGRKLLGPNDLVFADNGDLYFTDPGHSDLRHLTGRVLRIRVDGTVDVLIENLPYPNGLVLTPEQDALYVAVTRSQQILRLTLYPDVVGEHRLGLFLQLSGGAVGPDGMAMGPNGDVFVAQPGTGTVWHFDRLGEPLARYRSCAGLRTTNVTLSRDARAIFITESDSGNILRAALTS